MRFMEWIEKEKESEEEAATRDALRGRDVLSVRD